MTQFTLRTIDLPALHRHSIGFDQMFEQLNRFTNTKGESNYPPHNVVQLDDTHFVIEVAVAGFAEDEIDVELKDNVLTVTGKQKEPALEVHSACPGGVTYLSALIRV
jgi:molecular chaperone IbpA